MNHQIGARGKIAYVTSNFWQGELAVPVSPWICGEDLTGELLHSPAKMDIFISQIIRYANKEKGCALFKSQLSGNDRFQISRIEATKTEHSQELKPAIEPDLPRDSVQTSETRQRDVVPSENSVLADLGYNEWQRR